MHRRHIPKATKKERGANTALLVGVRRGVRLLLHGRVGARRLTSSIGRGDILGGGDKHGHHVRSQAPNLFPGCLLVTHDDTLEHHLQ